MESLSPLIEVLGPVKGHCVCTSTYKSFHLLLLCNYYKDVIFNTCFIWDTRVKVERDPLINTRIICFSNFLEWLYKVDSAFWCAPGCSWDLNLCFSKGGKIRFAEPQAVLRYWCTNSIRTVDCRLLLCRVGKQSFSFGVFRSWSNPSPGADRIRIAKTGIREVFNCGQRAVFISFTH